jgi:serine/threonine-protein kinase
MTEQLEEKICPRCKTPNQPLELEAREYRCAECGLELAHLDTAANGAIRGVFGWLLDIGQVVNDRYRVAAVLGKGGFGVTYLVDDLRLHGKRRALKEIPELLFDEHETRLLGRLNHPAIPDITDRFTRDGMVYLVLEFGGSRTLRTEQERQGGRIPVFALLPLIGQICSALTYLHAQDPPVVHRDLKPENILLDDNERVMLIDFGIAKESQLNTATRTLGRAVTHGYSPPEQVLGTGTDARSDVYALGAILYSMLTGQTPTPAHERITGKVLEPPSHVVPDVPPLLDAAVMQALELNINARQQSIEDLSRSLSLVQIGGQSARTVFAPDAAAMTAQVSTSSQVRLPSVQLPSSRPVSTTSSGADIRIAPPPPAVSQPKRARSALPLILAAVLLLAVGAGGGWYYLQRGESKPAAGTAQSKPAAGVERQASAPVGGVAGQAESGGLKQGPTPAAGPPASGLGQVPPRRGAALPGGAHQTAPAPSAAGPATASLPSIFSNEQKPAPRHRSDSAALMDIFDKRRRLHTEDLAPGPKPPTQPVAAEPAPPKQVVASEPAAKKHEHKRRHSNAPSSWTINYEGAHKTD